MRILITHIAIFWQERSAGVNNVKLLGKKIELGRRYVISDIAEDQLRDKVIPDDLIPIIVYKFYLAFGYRFKENVLKHAIQIVTLKYETIIEYEGQKYSGKFVDRMTRFLINEYGYVPTNHEYLEDLKKELLLRDNVGKLELEITNTIDFMPGIFGDSSTSCWWQSQHYSRGRVYFMHEMKKGKAFAFKFYFNDIPAGRAWCYLYRGKLILFNFYNKHLIAEQVFNALKRFFHADMTPIDFDTDRSDLYINDDRGYVFHKKSFGKTRLYIENFAEDYEYNLELERDREEGMIYTGAGFRCGICDEYRDYEDSLKYEIMLDSIVVCDYCFDDLRDRSELEYESGRYWRIDAK